MSYGKYYAGGWQSGETGGTPITPEALNHIEEGILGLDADKAPLANARKKSFILAAGGAACLKFPSEGAVALIAATGWHGSARGLFAYHGYAHGGPNLRSFCAPLVHDTAIAYGLNRESDDSTNGITLWNHLPATAMDVDVFMLHGDEPTVEYTADNADAVGFEDLHPPMQLGVEYRTRERYNGKPVYRKAVDMGTMPNAAISRIRHEIRDIDFCFLVEGSMFQIGGGNHVSFPYIESTTNFVSVELQKDYLVVSAGGNASAFTGVALLKYTKTTD